MAEERHRAGREAPAAEAAPTPVLIQETQYVPGGLGGGSQQVRVRPLGEGEPIPAGAVVVEGVEPHDWQPAPAA